MIDTYPVDSSMIAEVGYDEVSSTLRVTFKKGAENTAYDYPGVAPEKYIELMEAESIGSFFHRNIKGKYDTVKVEL